MTKPYERLGSQAYRARNRAVGADRPATLTATEWTETVAFFGHRCAYCARPLSRIYLDFWIPISSGGGAVKSNCLPSCGWCCRAKHADPRFVEGVAPPESRRLEAFFNEHGTPSKRKRQHRLVHYLQDVGDTYIIPCGLEQKTLPKGDTARASWRDVNCQGCLTFR